MKKFWDYLDENLHHVCWMAGRYILVILIFWTHSRIAVDYFFPAILLVCCLIYDVLVYPQIHAWASKIEQRRWEKERGNTHSSYSYVSTPSQRAANEVDYYLKTMDMHRKNIDEAKQKIEALQGQPGNESQIRELENSIQRHQGELAACEAGFPKALEDYRNS